METNIMFHVRTHTLYMQTRHAEISISLFLYALFVELMCALQRASSSLHACLCVYLFFPNNRSSFLLHIWQACLKLFGWAVHIFWLKVDCMWDIYGTPVWCSCNYREYILNLWETTQWNPDTVKTPAKIVMWKRKFSRDSAVRWNANGTFLFL